MKGNPMTLPSRWCALLHSPLVRWLCLLLLCAASRQGGLVKLPAFDGAGAEMRLFGLAPRNRWRRW